MQQKVTLKTAKKYVDICLQANKVPFLSASPGVGKSSLMRQIADEMNLVLIDIRLSQIDPVELSGFPKIDGNCAKFIPLNTFPLEGRDEVPEGKDGFLIFFDEINSAPTSVLKAAYQIILDRELGSHKIHPKALMACAGNLITDGALVNEMGTALRSRVIHIHVESNAEEFIEVMQKLDFDLRVVAYIDYQKFQLNNFEKFGTCSDETFACERTWEFTSDIVKQIEPDSTKPIPLEYATLLQGTLGSVAFEFVQFTQTLEPLPTLDEILENPEEAVIPKKPASIFLMLNMLLSQEYSSLEDLDQITKYIQRFSAEYGAVFAKRIISNFTKNVHKAKINPTMSPKFSELFKNTVALISN